MWPVRLSSTPPPSGSRHYIDQLIRRGFVRKRPRAESLSTYCTTKGGRAYLVRRGLVRPIERMRRPPRGSPVPRARRPVEVRTEAVVAKAGSSGLRRPAQCPHLAATRPHAAQARARWGALGVGYRIALGSRPRYRWSAVKAAAQSDPALRNAWIGSGDNRHRTCPCHLPRQVAPQPSVLRWEGRRRAGTVQSHPAPWPPLVARATRGAVAVRCAGNHSTPAGSLPRRHRMARIGSISSIRSVQVTGGSHR